MTATTTARATGMAEIVVEKKIITNIANHASVWTPRNKCAPKNADRLLLFKMVFATTTTTIAVVIGTKVIVAATLAKRIRTSSAKNASAWIPAM